MNKKTIGIILTCMLSISMLAGCGSSRAESASTDMPASTYAAYDAATEEAVADTSQATTDSADNTTTYEKKLIKTYDYNFETTDLDASKQQVQSNVDEFGGYIEASYCDDGYSASYTIRIPEDKADSFLSKSDSIGETVYTSESQEDITMSYYDTAAHIESLETQHKRLLELMEEATSIDDIISLEERLSDVEYELSSYEQQLKIYDNQVNYVTINIYITLVNNISALDNDSFIDKVTKGLGATFSDLGNDIINGIIWFIVHLPYIIVYGIIIAVIVFIIKKVRRHRLSKKALIQQHKDADNNIPDDNADNN